MKILLLASIIFILQFSTNAQYTQAFNFVLLPHSVSALGSGEQGVASLTNEDALIYNPAKLALTTVSKISYYRNPFQLIEGRSFPLASLSIYHDAGNAGFFGITYDNWDLGKVTILSPTEQGYEDVEMFERSIAAGYAKKLSDDFNAGVQLRYAYSYTDEIVSENFSLSLGLMYNATKRLTLGFSLMNLGPAVKYEHSASDFIYYDPPPSRLNAGINFITAQNDFFELPIKISISKPFDERDDEGQGQSSFKTLFTDWSDFPNDASFNLGVSLINNPVDLGKGFSIFSEFHAGTFSEGPKGGSRNFFTLAALIGLSYKGVGFAAGYGGYSHNVRYPNYLLWSFPYETFQFEVQIDNELLCKGTTSASHPSPGKFILSIGAGETVRIAKDREQSYFVFEDPENSLSYMAEAAIYFNEDNALVSTLNYSSFTHKEFDPIKNETISFFSSYRYHPVKSFHPAFIQGGAGIYRINPVMEQTRPRYDYKTAFQFSAGLMLDYLPFVISPVIDYNLILLDATGDAPRISGQNQFNFLLKIGYVLL